MAIVTSQQNSAEKQKGFESISAISFFKALWVNLKISS